MRRLVLASRGGFVALVAAGLVVLAISGYIIFVVRRAPVSIREAVRPRIVIPPRGWPDRFWAQAEHEVYRSTGELQAQHEVELRKGLFYRKLIHGNPRVRAVALTFDDGPHPLYTPKLLAVLRRYKIRATFFVVGKMAEQYPDLVKDEVRGGHVVGNHTFDHVNLTKIPLDEIPLEWQACSDVLRSITGQKTVFARPPGGDYDTAVIASAMDLGLTTVLWTDDPADYASPGAATIEARVLDRVSNGGIILLHDGIRQTIDVLPQMIESLRRRGYRFETVEEMAAGKRAP